MLVVVFCKINKIALIICIIKVDLVLIGCENVEEVSGFVTNPNQVSAYLKLDAI